MDTLGVQLYPSRYRADSGLSPVGTCARGAHNKKAVDQLADGIDFQGSMECDRENCCSEVETSRIRFFVTVQE